MENISINSVIVLSERHKGSYYQKKIGTKKGPLKMNSFKLQISFSK